MKKRNWKLEILARKKSRKKWLVKCQIKRFKETKLRSEKRWLRSKKLFDGHKKKVSVD